MEVSVTHLEYLGVALIGLGLWRGLAERSDATRRFVAMVVGAGVACLAIAFGRYWGDLDGQAIAAGSAVFAVLWPEFWSVPAGRSTKGEAPSADGRLEGVVPAVAEAVASAELAAAALPLSSDVVEEGTVVGASLPAELPTPPADPSHERPRPPEVLE